MTSSEVFPSKPIPAHTIKLSVCDAYSPKVWVTQCHFWATDEVHSFEIAYETLREGLSRTLAELPGFAGVIRRASQDPRDLIVDVQANAHVNLYSEDLTTSEDIPGYASLAATNFPVTGLVVPFSPPITLTPVSEGAPMLVAKLNKLQGGLALAFGFNHLLADASTVAEVERVWSSHTADVSARMTQVHTSLEGDDDARTRLSSAIDGSSSTFEDAHWKVFPTNMSQLNLPDQAVTTEAAMTMLQKAKEAHWAALNGGVKVSKWNIWRFTPESLAQLKRDAATSDSTKWISTMDGESERSSVDRGDFADIRLPQHL